MRIATGSSKKDKMSGNTIDLAGFLQHPLNTGHISQQDCGDIHKPLLAWIASAESWINSWEADLEHVMQKVAADIATVNEVLRVTPE